MRLKGLNEIVSNLINNIHDTLPSVDTKEGTFIRDVFVDPVAEEIARFYQELKFVEYSQSILTATGESLDKLAGNYFIKRQGMRKSIGTLRLYVEKNNSNTRPEKDFVLPKGTLFSAPQTNLNRDLYFTTLYSYQYFSKQVPTTLQFDQVGGQWYFEVEAESLEEGTQNNVDSYKIAQLPDGISPYISSVVNLLPFSGGSDGEDDVSLSSRVGIAILGSNIGTKDGYTSFMLKQPNVSEVRVVGAGDPLMMRDLKRNDDDPDMVIKAVKYNIYGDIEYQSDGITPKEVEIHEGGMVDVYFRSEKYDEEKYLLVYGNQNEIILPFQPVQKILSITGSKEENSSITQTQYFCEDNCDFELDDLGDKHFYQDIEWTYPSATGTTVKDKEIRSINKVLKSYTQLKEIPFANQYVEIQDSSTHPDEFSDEESPEGQLILDPNSSDSGEETLTFDLGSIDVDGNTYVYKLRPDTTSAFDESGEPYVFVKKNGKIYHRKYLEPSFRLKKNYPTANKYKVEDYYGSFKAQDSVEWIEGKKPSNQEQLAITYLCNKNVKELQNKIDAKRVITADILLKKTEPIKTIITLQISPYIEYTYSEVIKSTSNKVKTYMESFKGMGAKLDLASIISIARISEGVKYVSIGNSSIKVYRKNDQNQYVWQDKKSIHLNVNEFFDIHDVYVNVLSEEEFLGGE